MADALFESGTLLANVCRVFADKCVAGIEADEERCRAYAERSSAIATALNPIIGYAQAAEIVHRALDERRSIIDLVIEDGVLDEAEARSVLDPLHLTGAQADPIRVFACIRSASCGQALREYSDARRHSDGVSSVPGSEVGSAASPAMAASRASRRLLAPKRNVAGRGPVRRP